LKELSDDGGKAERQERTNLTNDRLDGPELTGAASINDRETQE
jgi:hypothetical protein